MLLNFQIFGNFADTILLLISISFMFRKRTLYDFCPLTFTETCFTVQHLVCLGECAACGLEERASCSCGARCSVVSELVDCAQISCSLTFFGFISY